MPLGDEERNAVMDAVRPHSRPWAASDRSRPILPHMRALTQVGVVLYGRNASGGSRSGWARAMSHRSAMTHAATACVRADARAGIRRRRGTTGNIDIVAIEAGITADPRHCDRPLFGMPVDMPLVVRLRQTCLFREDCALAVGATVDGAHVGLLGDCGVFSFYPVKHMTTAEGGMIILKDPELARKLALKKAFGVDRSHGERKVPGVYDVVDLGFNYRMSEIHAAIGIEQVKKIPGFQTRRDENFRVLAQSLAGVPGIELLGSTTNRLVSTYCLSVVYGAGAETLRSWRA